MMENNKEIEVQLKSDQMNEMLSHPPKWIIRSGNSLFLIILMIVVILSWLIEYPDEINGEVMVTTTKPPIELTNQSYIQLKSLNVTENQDVQSGDLLAQFDIQANSADIKSVMKYLTALERLNGKFDRIPLYSPHVQLGDFQESWTKLNSLITDWNNQKEKNLTAKQIGSIQREISLRKQLETISDKRIRISEEEYQLIKEELESSQRLADQNAISRQVLSIDKKGHSQALQTLQSQKEQKVQNLITLNSLNNQLTQLKNEAEQVEQQKLTEIQIAVTSLRNAFLTWERNSAWVAPCSGKILFNKILQVNRYYKPAEASIVIVPKGGGYSAIANVSSEGAGKIQTGQTAFIELVDYPKNEYGQLKGKITSITQIDKEGKYEVKIQLSKQLQTTYRKQIAFKAQCKGTVKIITKNKRLLTRLFERLISIWE